MRLSLSRLWRGPRKQRLARRSSSSRLRLQLEALEDRVVPSTADPGLSNLSPAVTSQTINPAALTATVTLLTGNTLSNGQVGLDVTVTGLGSVLPPALLGLLNGNLVEILDNGQPLVAVNLTNGTGSAQVTLPPGNNLLTAVFGGISGLLGGSTSLPITIGIGGGGGGGSGGGGGGSGSGGSGSGGGGVGSGAGSGSGQGGFVVPPPLDAAVQAANQSTFFVEGFVLKLQPLLSNPFALAAVANGLSSSLGDSSDPNFGLLMFEEFRLFSDLSAYINNPDAYAPNAAPTVALANQVRNDAAPILFNPALGSNYSGAVFGGALELFMLSGNNPQAAGPEAALAQLAPALF